MLAQINPKIEVVHHEQADEATECITVMGQDFKSLTYEAIANVPGYDRWLLGVDQRSAYEYHRSVLQVLQSGGVRGRWTLKSPHHAIALEHLTAVYPDAHLVLLHRDPVVLTASVCSLISTLSSTFTDVDHRAYIAEHWPAMLEESIRRIDAFRDAHPDRTDRRRAVRRSRDRSDAARWRRSTRRAVTSSTTVGRRAIADYVDAHPKGQFGAHTYDVAEFGLDADELAERFAGYIDRYDVPSEPWERVTCPLWSAVECTVTRRCCDPAGRRSWPPSSRVPRAAHRCAGRRRQPGSGDRRRTRRSARAARAEGARRTWGARRRRGSPRAWLHSSPIRTASIGSVDATTQPTSAAVRSRSQSAVGRDRNVVTRASASASSSLSNALSSRTWSASAPTSGAHSWSAGAARNTQPSTVS